MKPLLVFLALLPIARGASASPAVTLSDVLTESAHNPLVQSAQRRADGAQAQARAAKKSYLLPAISVAASGNLRDRDFTLSTPAGVLPITDQTFVQSQLRIEQPLVDVAKWKGARAAELGATAARLEEKRSAEESSYRAAMTYLDLLSVRARQSSTQSYLLSLRARLEEVSSLVDAERAIRTDYLQTSLALQAAEQEHHTLEENGNVLEIALGHAMGRTGAVSAAPLAQAPPEQSPTTASPTLRSDLVALDSQRRAAQARADATQAEWYPTVSIRGDAVYTDAGPQSETRFLQGTVNLVWVPFASGTRSARREAAVAQSEALSLALEHKRRGVAVEVARAEAQARIASGNIALAVTQVAQAQEAAAVTRARYGAGRETIREVLETEALLRDALVNQEVAAIEATRANLSLRFSQGRPLQQ